MTRSTVRNFHSTRSVTVRPTTVLRPFNHWAQPNFDCLALHTPGELMLQVHAKAAPQRQAAAEEEPAGSSSSAVSRW